MKKGKEKKVNADNWRPHALQLIAFLNSPPVDQSQSWCEDLTGRRPTESIKRANEKIDKGNFEGTILTVASDLLKVTFTYSPAPLETPSTDTEFEPIPTIGAWGQSRDFVVEQMTRWLKGQHPPIKRLTLAGKLLQITENRESGNRLLSRYLHSMKLDPNSLDFSYRINRPRPSASGIRNLKINRLCTWGVLRATVTARQQIQTGEIVAPNVFEKEIHACTLDIDINSDGEFPGTLPQRRLVALFQEFADLATEIAHQGDIP